MSTRLAEHRAHTATADGRVERQLLESGTRHTAIARTPELTAQGTRARSREEVAATLAKSNTHYAGCDAVKHQMELLTPNDDRPHRRCSVCHAMRVYPQFAMPSEMDEMDKSSPPCPGPFVMPPVDSAQFREKMTRWIKARMPFRDSETVTIIWTTCCEPCEQRGGENVCGASGCRVLPSGPPECNLIAMATEVCPLGKWK